MKKTLIAISVLACSTSFAYAETNGFYVGGQLGGSILNARSLDKHWDADEEEGDPAVNLGLGSIHKTKIAGALNLGYNFKPVYDIPVRTELSYTLRGNLNKDSDTKNFIDPDDGEAFGVYQKTKARMNTLMLNGYYDIDTGTAITPFVSAGLGLAFAKLEGTMYIADYDIDDLEKLSKSKTKFAWSLGAGAAYKVTDNVDIDFTARYLNAGKITAKEYDTKTSAKLSAVDFLVGVRYNF